jgi:hypothetical protein
MSAEQLNLLKRINELRRQANFEAYESLLRVYYKLYGLKLNQKDCARMPFAKSGSFPPKTNF